MAFVRTELLRRDLEHADLHALPDEGLDHGPAYPRASAGYQRNLAA